MFWGRNDTEWWIRFHLLTYISYLRRQNCKIINAVFVWDFSNIIFYLLCLWSFKIYKLLGWWIQQIGHFVHYRPEYYSWFVFKNLYNNLTVFHSYVERLQAVFGDGDAAVSKCPVCPLSALVSWLVSWRKERDWCLRCLRGVLTILLLSEYY